VNWDDIIIDAAATDTGMRRSNNQDSHSAVRATNVEMWRQRGHLFMVADGMGAHAVGELASKMACDNIPHYYNKTKAGTPAEAISKAFREVGALIHGRATANRDFQGMGTTCSSLLLLPQGALIAHVGDSRVYRVRRGRIDQLSFDHSLAWELIRRNHLSPENAHLSVPKNVITRSLGPEATVEVDVEGPLAVEPGDVYLLCSDGLTGLVTDPEVGAFAENFHPKDACRYLVSLANLRGGHDNITVMILRVGPWVDPEGTDEAAAGASGQASSAREKAGGWRNGLTKLLGSARRTSSPATVEEHPYRTAECPLNPELVDSISELTRKVQAQAIEQAWSLDWTEFATFRRQEAEARASGDHRAALRAIGETLELLGQAAREHKTSGADSAV
jgi:PPM family protein phosphatase